LNFLGVLTLDLIHLFIFFFFDLPHGLVMLPIKHLNFLDNVFLPFLLVLDALLIVLFKFSQLLIVLGLISLNLLLEHLGFLLLSSF
jgi:hypothetical protein